ncbi:MAG: hypothetical protein RRA94_03620 [Bacteroidota bacterium]|nr:hypothetical protein [Bacteroidota bacterium]
MSKFETSFSDSTDCDITLFHDPDDPLSWVVRKWKKQLFWKRCESSRWFNTRAQAEEYAAGLLEQCRRQERLSA